MFMWRWSNYKSRFHSKYVLKDQKTIYFKLWQPYWTFLKAWLAKKKSITICGYHIFILGAVHKSRHQFFEIFDPIPHSSSLLINKQTPLDSVLASISVNTFDVSFWSVFINTLFPADTIRKYRIVWYNFVQELLRKAIVRPTDQPE